MYQIIGHNICFHTGDSSYLPFTIAKSNIPKLREWLVMNRQTLAVFYDDQDESLCYMPNPNEVSFKDPSEGVEATYTYDEVLDQLEKLIIS